MLRSGTLILLLVLGLSQGAAAQVPDTLDPRGYFPLQVGNLWEYQHYLRRPLSIYRPVDESETRHERYYVVDSTAQGDTLFYVVTLEERSEHNVLIGRDTLLLWFDESTSSISGVKLPGILDWLRCLNAPFDPVGPLPSGCWPFVGRHDQAFPDLFGSAFVAVKGFSSFVWSYSAVHGVGVVAGSGGCEPCGTFDDWDAWTLKYARIGGVIYGSQIVKTEQSRRHVTGSLAVYPNPTAGWLRVEAPGGEWVALYDLLGRRVRVERLDASGWIEMEVSNLVPGLYILKAWQASVMVTVL